MTLDTGDVDILEVERIREAYARRDANVDPLLYSMFHPAHLLLHQSRERALLRLLARSGICGLSSLRILEVGCGKCDVLSELLVLGAHVPHVHGVDLLLEHLREGKLRNSALRLSCADGGHLPLRDGSFDIVLQSTFLSSVLSDRIREKVAQEMLRVLRPGGLLISYDFWPNNPKNPDVRGLKLREVKRLFPAPGYDIQRIVLAPPIARPLVKVSRIACLVLEKVPWLCTHYLVGCIPAKRAGGGKLSPVGPPVSTSAKQGHSRISHGRAGLASARP